MRKCKSLIRHSIAGLLILALIFGPGVPLHAALIQIPTVTEQTNVISDATTPEERQENHESKQNGVNQKNDEEEAMSDWHGQDEDANLPEGATWDPICVIEGFIVKGLEGEVIENAPKTFYIRGDTLADTLEKGFSPYYLIENEEGSFVILCYKISITPADSLLGSLVTTHMTELDELKEYKRQDNSDLLHMDTIAVWIMAGEEEWHVIEGEVTTSQEGGYLVEGTAREGEAAEGGKGYFIVGSNGEYDLIIGEIVETGEGRYVIKGNLLVDGSVVVDEEGSLRKGKSMGQVVYFYRYTYTHAEEDDQGAIDPDGDSQGEIDPDENDQDAGETNENTNQDPADEDEGSPNANGTDKSPPTSTMCPGFGPLLVRPIDVLISYRRNMFFRTNTSSGGTTSTGRNTAPGGGTVGVTLTGEISLGSTIVEENPTFEVHIYTENKKGEPIDFSRYLPFRFYSLGFTRIYDSFDELNNTAEAYKERYSQKAGQYNITLRGNGGESTPLGLSDGISAVLHEEGMAQAVGNFWKDIPSALKVTRLSHFSFKKDEFNAVIMLPEGEE